MGFLYLMLFSWLIVSNVLSVSRQLQLFESNPLEKPCPMAFFLDVTPAGDAPRHFVYETQST